MRLLGRMLFSTFSSDGLPQGFSQACPHCMQCCGRVRAALVKICRMGRHGQAQHAWRLAVWAALLVALR